MKGQNQINSKNPLINFVMTNPKHAKTQYVYKTFHQRWNMLVYGNKQMNMYIHIQILTERKYDRKLKFLTYSKQISHLEIL